MKIVAAGAVAALAAVLIVMGPSREAEAVSEDVPPASNAQLSALQELVTQLRQENDQLEHFDEQLSSARRASADEELSRDEEVQSQAARHTATVQALETLRQVDALLEIGDSDGVDDQLAVAEAALAGPTRIDVDAAREALERSDLYAARMYLAAALAERRPLR